jgi:hypothetical protein
MKLLINDKEIAQFLAKFIDHRSIIDQIEHNEHYTGEALVWALEKKKDDQFIPKKFAGKAVEKITWGVRKDFADYVKKLGYLLKNKQRQDFLFVYKNIHYIIDRLGIETILDIYKHSNSDNFVKSVGLLIDPEADLVRRRNFRDRNEDCLIRNTVGNEDLLISKIDNDLPFWFIDSGYTNFTEKGKRWHRLVRNHLHYNRYFDAPSDRLQNFTEFPRPWRSSGERILVIEPGEFSANIFHTDVSKWRQEITDEIRQYSDKKIVFREKIPKKQRPKLYKELLDGDYYCVVNINSNAATEAIWAGVPVITLGKHITNPVSRSQIKDINDLYRGPLGNWLAFLSYNQFTYDELIDGTAIQIIKEYHG